MSKQATQPSLSCLPQADGRGTEGEGQTQNTMHKNIIKIILTSAIFLACKKDHPGCTDPSSTSYDPKATIDDGSCKHPADAFAGIYNALESVSYSDPFSGAVVNRLDSYQFSLSKTAPDSLTVSNLGAACNTVGIVSGGTLVLPNAQTDCNIGAFHCHQSGDTLKYTFNRFNGTTEIVSGKARKQ